MSHRIALLALLLFGEAAGAQAPAVIRVDDAGPGVGPAILVRALAQPHVVVAPAPDRFLVARGREHRQTIVVLGRDVVVEGKVQGDVIVVAGDVYMHPGGSISGRAIAIGGGVYESMLATIGGSIAAFREFTYDIVPIAGGYALRYRSLAPAEETGLTWPGFSGVAVPSYDRSDGLSIGGGPSYSTPGSRIVVTPMVTYRSQLGRLDPWVDVSANPDRRTTVRLRAGRTTASNDRWIRGDLVNSAVFFADGDDARNYYRATGGDLTVRRAWESASGRIVPYVGVRYERASGVRPGLGATGGPWTLFARDDEDRDDRLRPNPSVDDGTITSAIAGAGWEWSDAGLVAHLRGDAEAASDFAQLTLDGAIELPTFGTQSLAVNAHVVSTAGAQTPRQRFAYLGGPGTLSTLDILSEGGNELAFFDASYHIPIDRAHLPVVGSPAIILREALGGARVGRFPTLHQAMGVRVALGPVYAEEMIDPVAHHSHRSLGLSFAR